VDSGASWSCPAGASDCSGTGQDAVFRLLKDSGPEGFAVETGNGAEVVGHPRTAA